MQVNTHLLACIASPHSSCLRERISNTSNSQAVYPFLSLFYNSGKCQGSMEWQGLPTAAPEMRRQWKRKQTWPVNNSGRSLITVRSSVPVLSCLQWGNLKQLKKRGSAFVLGAPHIAGARAHLNGVVSSGLCLPSTQLAHTELVFILLRNLICFLSSSRGPEDRAFLTVFLHFI